MSERTKPSRHSKAQPKLEWRVCSLHPDVVGARMWGCPDCLAELRREVRNLERENTLLRETGSKEGRSVIRAAIYWWEQRRPLSYSLDLHIKYPRVNCATDGDCALANNCAHLARKRKEIRK